MARNVEIKARVRDPDALERRVRELADKGPIHISQDDTFFRCSSGRLKLRVIAEDFGELIFYRRTDEAGPRESFYIRTETNQPRSLQELLTLAYGVAGQVRKHRSLYWIGRTRVHLDIVDSLGVFIELEVVLRKDESTDSGSAEASEILERLGVAESELIDVAYIDLLSSEYRSLCRQKEKA